MEEIPETKEDPKATEPEKKVEEEKPQSTPLIDIANAAAERMEKANIETARLQEMQAERDRRIALGGKAEAGQAPVKKEYTPEEYATKVQSGELNG